MKVFNWTLEDCSEKERAAEFASKQVIQNLLSRYAKQFSGQNFFWLYNRSKRIWSVRRYSKTFY